MRSIYLQLNDSYERFSIYSSSASFFIASSASRGLTRTMLRCDARLNRLFGRAREKRDGVPRAERLVWTPQSPKHSL